MTQLQEIDHHFLLFSQNIEEPSIEFDDQRSTFSKNVGEPNGSDVREPRSRYKLAELVKKIELRDGKVATKLKSAAETSKRSSCMFCLQIKNDVCVPHARHTGL